MPLALSHALVPHTIPISAQLDVRDMDGCARNHQRSSPGKRVLRGLLGVLVFGLQVRGHIEVEGKKQEFPQLHGKWDGALWARAADGSEQLLWQKNPPHEHPSRSACCSVMGSIHPRPIIIF